MVAIHSVRDYDRWKRVFDEGCERRRDHGVRRHWIYRSVDDPDEVMVTLEFATRQEAEELLRVGDAQEWMDRIGIDIYPAILIGEEMEVFDYASLGGSGSP
jgi:hypothetical protein